jgi:bifunctional DNA-binding transcriptional regulator/antitoxin component of YhaV-PrlF toxin-antitoxin module
MKAQHPLSSLLSHAQLNLEVETDGQFRLPAAVRETLGLEAGDLFSLTRNAISIRLDPYKDLLEDLQRSVKEPGNWRFLEQFLRRTLTSVGADGGVAIPPKFLALHAGDPLVLEVVAEGFRHALYIYRADA